MDCGLEAERFRAFAGLSRGQRVTRKANGRHAFSADSGGRTVLSYRAGSGFGGLIVVTAILLGIQAISGVAAFPL
jgi:hypothetical protein